MSGIDDEAKSFHWLRFVAQFTMQDMLEHAHHEVCGGKKVNAGHD